MSGTGAIERLLLLMEAVCPRALDEFVAALVVAMQQSGRGW
jgi:hypothetical protein